jgi:flagellar hook-associated protein 3 FlgL
MMRISTLNWARTNTNAMLEQQARLARTQNEVATGVRVRTPADDPIAAARISGLDRALAESQQFERNATAVEVRLQTEEQALADAVGVLQRVRELAVQGSNATVGPDERRAITSELRSRLEEILAIANRTDGAGEYLFAGLASDTQPFARGASSVSYAGDSSARLVKISPTQSIANGHSGDAVFMSALAGNGTFTTRASGANTGSGVVDVGSVVDPAAWSRDVYTVRMTAANAYEVVDSANNTVTTGAYTSGSAIEFRGIRVSVTGAPAAGDTFTVAPAGRSDVFTVIDGLIANFEGSTVTDADKARFASVAGASLAGLDNSIDRILDVRAEVGARLSALESAASTREGYELELQSSLSDLRDIDYAEAVTRLNQQYSGLQAAQAAYTRISQLSLFDYL